ncbi:MAG: VWA domain-containing protein [Candidatus Aminicenantes bacterium]|nr:VWA domain-containing protein [Candidatus Aminicenantes bacterium]
MKAAEVRRAFLEIGRGAWYFGSQALTVAMKTKVLVVLILASLAVFGPAGAASAQDQVKDQVAHEYVVRAITLAVTVQDSKGRFVNNLVEKNFTIFENNKKKPLSYFMHDFGSPLRLTVLLDVRGSMALDEKLADCKAALSHLATKLLRPRDEIALLIFADGQVEVAARHATDKSEFLRVLDKTEAYGQTALNDAVGVSPEFATRARNEKRALLLLTDGIDNDSAATPEEALEVARRVDVPIYTIGYKIPMSEQMLRAHKRSSTLTAAGIVATLDKFSTATGGKAYFLNEPADLASVVQEIRNEQSHQYIIGYTSYQDTAELYRWIRVTTPNYKHKIRTRQGY